MDSSAKHSRRVDEQLDRDVAALVHGAADEGRQEWRRVEAPGDGEPEVVAAPRSDEEAILELRASIARALVPSTFPATAGALADIAAGAHAPPPVLDSLRALPEGRVYQTVGELCQDLGIDDVAGGTGHVSSGDDGRATSDDDHDVPADAPAVADDDVEAGEGVPERVVDQQAALADAVEHQRDEGSAAAGG